MSSPPAQRRRVIGLPRAARQLSNTEEVQRRAAERAVIRQLDVQIDLTSSSEDDSYEQGYVSPLPNAFSESPPAPPEADVPRAAVVAPEAAVPLAAIVAPEAAARAVASTSARSRTQWTNNHPKLNIMARFVCKMACDLILTKQIHETCTGII